MADGQAYMAVVFLHMLACENLLIPKSRQIRMSWMSCAFAVWWAMSAKYRQVLYQTKNERDALNQTTKGSNDPGDGRMDFIIQHLPGWMMDTNITSGRGNKAGELIFTQQDKNYQGVPILWQGSKISAIPGHSKPVRQYTVSLMINDESAYQDEYRSSMKAAAAAVVGGGSKLFSVSSVDNNSFFNYRVLESDDDRDPANDASCWGEVNPTVQVALDLLEWEMPEGIRTRRNASGAWVCEVKYTADKNKNPEKDNWGWANKAVEKYDGGFEGEAWQTEMEVNYGAGGGTPIFPYLSIESPIHVPAIPPEVAKQYMRFYAGYDYGSSSPSAFLVVGVDKENIRRAVWELYEPCINLNRHVERMKECPYWDVIEHIICDPSMTYKNQRDSAGELRSINRLFLEQGVAMFPGNRGQDWAIAQMVMSDFWGDHDKDDFKPGLEITAACPNFWWECCNLRRKEYVSDAVKQRKNPQEGIRDKDNHAWDAYTVVEDYGMEPFVKPANIIVGNTMHKYIEAVRRGKTDPAVGGIAVV